MRDTSYAKELARAEINGCRIERLWVKKLGQIHIRFSWWPSGRLVTRPLDLPEHELLELLRGAVREGVLTETFVGKLLSILCDAQGDSSLKGDTGELARATISRGWRPANLLRAFAAWLS
jgi:hypothetical protein